MFRCTPEEIEKIKYLHNKKWHANEIGREIGKCSTTVLFHLGRLRSRMGKESSGIPEYIRKNLEEREIERIEKIEAKKVKKDKDKDKTKCVVCGGRKIGKWRLTNYCSLKCYV